MRCERGSVDVVLPASSRFIDQPIKGRGMPIIGLDIHRAIAEAVASEDELRRLGRVDMRRNLLTAFAVTLSWEDIVVVEAPGNAAAVASVIGPHVKRVVIANPIQVARTPGPLRTFFLRVRARRGPHVAAVATAR
jgi:hypothetical protein